MSEKDLLAQRFEEHRPHLRAVAYRMLGSLGEAEDAVPFDEIADVLGRTPAATRQLASRARRRVQGQAPAPDTDLARRRSVVDAFLAAARGGDFDALVAVLDPGIVARSDGGALRPGLIRRGAAAVASQAITFARFAEAALPALVNGAPGVVAVAEGRALSVMAFTIRNDRVTGPRHPHRPRAPRPHRPGRPRQVNTRRLTAEDMRPVRCRRRRGCCRRCG